MKHRILAVLITAPFLFSAGMAEERALTTDEIAALLPTVVVLGTDTRQTFSIAGATTYSQGGRDSYGSWWAEGDEYCSRWPPADGFACYAVTLDNTPPDGGDPILRWTGESGHTTTTRITPK